MHKKKEKYVVYFFKWCFRYLKYYDQGSKYSLSTQQCSSLNKLRHRLYQIEPLESTSKCKLGKKQLVVSTAHLQQPFAPLFTPSFILSTKNRRNDSLSLRRQGGQRWIRTTEGVSQQIYSLPHLATLVFALFAFAMAKVGIKAENSKKIRDFMPFSPRKTVLYPK